MKAQQACGCMSCHRLSLALPLSANAPQRPLTVTQLLHHFRLLRYPPTTSLQCLAPPMCASPSGMRICVYVADSGLSIYREYCMHAYIAAAVTIGVHGTALHMRGLAESSHCFPYARQSIVLTFLLMQAAAQAQGVTTEEALEARCKLRVDDDASSTGRIRSHPMSPCSAKSPCDGIASTSSGAEASAVVRSLLSFLCLLTLLLHGLLQQQGRSEWICRPANLHRSIGSHRNQLAAHLFV
jgi:hypothetical protein